MSSWTASCWFSGGNTARSLDKHPWLYIKWRMSRGRWWYLFLQAQHSLPKAKSLAKGKYPCIWWACMARDLLDVKVQEQRPQRISKGSWLPTSLQRPLTPSIAKLSSIRRSHNLPLAWLCLKRTHALNALRTIVCQLGFARMLSSQDVQSSHGGMSTKGLENLHNHLRSCTNRDAHPSGLVTPAVKLHNANGPCTRALLT